MTCKYILSASNAMRATGIRRRMNSTWRRSQKLPTTTTCRPATLSPPSTAQMKKKTMNRLGRIIFNILLSTNKQINRLKVLKWIRIGWEVYFSSFKTICRNDRKIVNQWFTIFFLAAPLCEVFIWRNTWFVRHRKVSWKLFTCIIWRTT